MLVGGAAFEVERGRSLERARQPEQSGAYTLIPRLLLAMGPTECFKVGVEVLTLAPNLRARARGPGAGAGPRSADGENNTDCGRATIKSGNNAELPERIGQQRHVHLVAVAGLNVHDLTALVEPEQVEALCAAGRRVAAAERRSRDA